VDLRPGLVIRTLPRFFSGTLDGPKIEANSGIMLKDGSLWAKGDWRPISEREAEILGLPVKAEGGKIKEEFPEVSDTLWVFSIPLHLLRHWQRISGRLASEAGPGSSVEDGPYQKFVSQVADFFRFKGVPLPSKSKFEIVSHASEISTTSGVPASEEKHSSAEVEVPLVSSHEVQVAVNLSPAPSGLLFVNLSSLQLESILAEHADPSRVENLRSVERFFSRFPTYPALRLILPPRAGYVLGGLDIVHSRCSLSQAQSDLWLCVSAVPD
jgi:hypothetical protein